MTKKILISRSLILAMVAGMQANLIHATNLSGENDAEYFTVVPQNGTNYGYRLYFSQGADGVWRLQSL